MDYRNSAKEHLLRETGQYIDHYDCWSSNDPSSHKAAIGRTDLVKHLALFIGKLWRYNPTLFTAQTPDLVAIPDNLSGLEGSEYDKAVMEILANRCARLPRWEDTYTPTRWDETWIEFPDAPVNTDEIIISTIDIYFNVLLYETQTEGIAILLDILLSNAWELYLRAWEHANA